jgi:hypothetical protein
MIGNPWTFSFGVTEYTETPPILKLLFDHCGGGLGLQAQGVAAKVQQLASLRVVRMMKLLRKTGERIRSILRRSVRALKIVRGQAGACMTVPHTLHVRRDKLE